MHQTHSSKLNDRILWYDGSMSMTPEQIEEYLLSGFKLNDNIFVTDINKDIETFNSLNPERALTTKQAFDLKLDTIWNIPEYYKTIDIKKFIFGKLLKVCEDENLNDEKTNIRIKRVEDELELYNKYKIIDILRTLIYVVDMFKEKRVVWGTGRGSSCSSYILYLIEIHDVDSVEYELDITEFLR